MAGSYGLGRAIPLIALSSHVALADLTATMIKDEKTRRSGIAVVGVIGVIGMLGTSQGWVQMIPRVLLPDSVVTGDQLRDYISPYRSIESVLGPTDIAFGSPWMNKVVPSVTGRVVVPGHLTPLLSDRMEREAASNAFFEGDQSTAERNAIAAQWSATHVVVQPDDVPSLPWLARDYSLASETDAYVVFLIEPGSGDR